MTEKRPGSHAPTRRPSGPFRPRFSIGLLYLIGFFFLFAFLQILPELIGLLDLPAGPDQESAARELAREHSNPLASLVLSLVVTALGGYYRALPGLSEG